MVVLLFAERWSCGRGERVEVEYFFLVEGGDLFRMKGARKEGRYLGLRAIFITLDHEIPLKDLAEKILVNTEMAPSKLISM